MSYGKHHLAMTKSTWQNNVLSGHFARAWDNLGLREIEQPTWEDFKSLIGQIETGVKWSDLEAYSEENMRRVFEDPKTRLMLLTRNDETIGYSLIVAAKPNVKRRFFSAANDNSVIEIENLALFSNQRGQGVGKSCFEMVLNELFKQHDTVYWGTSDFNASTLVKFYTDKMKMTVLGYDAPQALKRA